MIRNSLQNPDSGLYVPVQNLVLHAVLLRKTQKFSVADPDPGSGAFLTPGSGIRDKHPGSATLQKLPQKVSDGKKVTINYSCAFVIYVYNYPMTRVVNPDTH